MTKKTIKKLFSGLLLVGIMSLFILPLTVNTVSAEQDDSDLWLQLQDDLGGDSKASLTQIISGVIKIIMGALGVIMVFIILWGGFIWMTALGTAEKVDKAKKMIYSGIIGLVVILSAYAVATFVINSITGIVK